MIRLGICGALLVGVAARASLVSTFDLDAEGWKTADLSQVTGKPTGATAAVSYNSSGYIVTSDTLDWCNFAAPSAFLGDKSAYYGGRFSFDLGDTYNDFGVPGALVAGPLIVLYGNNTVIAVPSLPPAKQGFTHYSLPLLAGNWLAVTSFAPGGLAPASTATIRHVLENLQGVYISADWHTGEDDSRLDNVVLAAPVPEPSTFLTGFVALGLLGWIGRKAQ
jgi:hypothetical protein